MSLFQVVYGGSLPPRYIHTPYSSFAGAGSATPTTAAGGGTEATDSGPEYALEELSQQVQELVEEEVVGVCTELALECIAEVSPFAPTLFLNPLFLTLSFNPLARNSFNP